MMVDFNRLSSAWVKWTSRARMPGVSVLTDGVDGLISFIADDQSFYLSERGGWWIVDRVNDRGKRYNDIAKFSTFELAEKYLIWDWALFTRNSLRGVEPMGPELFKQGYSSDVSVVTTDDEWRSEIKSRAGSAILGEPDSIIFSYFMSKSVDEIEQTIGEGIS